MSNEPGAAVLALFAQLIDRVKQRSPVGSNDKPIGKRVYSQLVLGMPIDREDYLKPWSPSGGASLRESFPPPPEGAPPATPAPDPQMLRAMRAAWNTSILCKTMLAVTTDGSYREYPTGRHLDFAYDAILSGMTPLDIPEEPEDIKNRRLAAQKTLYNALPDGNIDFGSKTSLHQNYLKNADALAEAKADYAVANSLAMMDPARAAIWPVEGQRYSRKVKQARDTLVAEGAEQVEKALAVLNSIGIPAEARMISRAKDAWDSWNLELSGIVPAKSPYSVVFPTNWCDPDNHDGWETLVVDSSSYKHFDAANARSEAASSWSRSARTTGGGGAITFGFAAFGGSGSTSTSSSSWQSSSGSTFTSSFSNTATDLHIEMEYGLCTIIRPWLISDLFFVKHWYLANQKKNSISDGTIDGQAESQEKLMPMIPQQFLVVRNVVIRSSNWGSDGSKLSEYYGAAQGQAGSNSSHVAGSGGVSLGWVNFGGSASRSTSSASGSASAWSASSESNYFGTTFDGETLRIPGAQIVAFLSDITPANPELDDPHLTQ